MYFAPRINDLIAHRFDDTRQSVGANVWVGIAKYICGSAVLAKDAENLFYITTLLGTCVEFAVRKSTCAAFAKGVVALAIYGVLA